MCTAYMTLLLYQGIVAFAVIAASQIGPRARGPREAYRVVDCASRAFQGSSCDERVDAGHERAVRLENVSQLIIRVIVARRIID